MPLFWFNFVYAGMTARFYCIENRRKYKNFGDFIFINKKRMGIGESIGIKVKAKAQCQKGKGTISSNEDKNNNISSKVKE